MNKPSKHYFLKNAQRKPDSVKAVGFSYANRKFLIFNEKSLSALITLKCSACYNAGKNQHNQCCYPNPNSRSKGMMGKNRRTVDWQTQYLLDIHRIHRKNSQHIPERTLIQCLPDNTGSRKAQSLSAYPRSIPQDHIAGQRRYKKGRKQIPSTVWQIEGTPAASP